MTLRLDDGTTQQTNADDAGAFAFTLPSVGQWFDLTVAQPLFSPVRSEQKCAGHHGIMSFTLLDQLSTNRRLGIVLGAAPEVADAGRIFAYVANKSGAGVAGAVLSTEPALPDPHYGEDYSWPYSCARGPCAAGGNCPSGQRCESGVCVVGASGPLCQSCLTTSCPQGYQNGGATALDGGTACYCLPRTAGCDVAAPTCEAGTYC